MSKYKVLKKFKDIHTKELYTEGMEIELTEERAAEVNENLKGLGTFIELIEIPKGKEDVKDKFDREAAKEKLKEMGVEFKANAKNETLKQLLEENEEDK
ncbi:MAG: hypothetical protein AB2375_07905 [Tissierellaceae bacterium]